MATVSKISTTRTSMPIIARPASMVAASHARVPAHLFALVAAILVLVWTIHFGGGLNLHSDNTDLIFNVHPVVMVLGFIIIIGEGIMVHRTIPAERHVRKSIHMMLQFVALVLGIFGVYVAFKYHRKSEIPDMYTLHSWLGMVTICLFGLQWLFGFFYFWYPRVPEPTRIIATPVYATAGLAIFLLTICTAESGFVQKGADPGTETRLINFAGLFILLFAMAVCLSTALPRVLTI